RARIHLSASAHGRWVSVDPMTTPDVWPAYGCLHPMHDDDCTCGHGPVDGKIRAQPCVRCEARTASIVEFALAGAAAAAISVPSGTVTAAVFCCPSCQGNGSAET